MVDDGHKLYLKNINDELRHLCKKNITLYSEAPRCPNCNVRMDFERNLQKGFLYRCPDCFKLWKVEDEE